MSSSLFSLHTRDTAEEETGSLLGAHLCCKSCISLNLKAESLFAPSWDFFFFFLPVFAQTQRQSGLTHLEAAAQGVYFSPQRCVFLRDFVLLLSLIFSLLQSLSQLAVKPEWTQKRTGKKSNGRYWFKKNGTTALQQATSAHFRRTPTTLAVIKLYLL